MIQAVFQYVWIAILPLSIVLAAGLLVRMLLPRDTILRYRLQVALTVLAVLVLPGQWILVESSTLRRQAESTNVPGDPANVITIAAPDGDQRHERSPGFGALATRAAPNHPMQETSSFRINSDVLLSVYVGGALAITIVLSLRLLNTIRFLARCRRMESSRVKELITNATEPTFGGTIWLESKTMKTPACAWFFRPIMIVPSDVLHRFPSEQLQCVIRHELIHLRRRDWLVSVIAGTLRAVYWFHPLVWLSTRNLGIDRELSCDALVVRENQSPKTYAETLLQLCQEGRSESHFAVVPLGSQIPISRRIKMLSHYRRRSHGPLRLTLLIAIAGFTLLAGWLQMRNVNAADLPRLLSASSPLGEENSGTHSSSKPITQESEVAPPVVGSIEAIKSGRSDREMFDHFQQSMELTGGTWSDDGWITNQESLVSSENATVHGNVISSRELTFNLPEGSNLTAQFFGKRVSMEQQPGASVITIHDGELTLVDADGVIRVIGQLPADAPDHSVIQVTTTYARDEITMEVRGKDENGNAIAVEAEFDATTGVPENEEQPPHKAIRYELFGEENEGKQTLKMQWIYQLGELRRSVERNRG